MSEPLYLKYRPQKLAELVGQEIIARTLTNAITMKRIAHAYFFTGPRGCGKTSSARILAKSLNCKSGPTIDPCGECQNCLEIAQGISPDVIEIDAASHRSVEDASQVIERCHLAPQTAKYKIYIFDEVHMLSKEAFNALLKTIEEPPENVVFILATTEENKVPATIVSRCQRFAFRPIEQVPLLQRLKDVAAQEQIKLTEGAFLKIVKQCKGGLRDALSLLDQVSILAPLGETVDEKLILDLFGAVSDDKLETFLKVLEAEDSNASLIQVNDFLASGVDPSLLVRNLVEFAIDKLEEEILSGSKPKKLISIIDNLIKAEYSLRQASQPTLKLKSLILSICVPTSLSGETNEVNGLLSRIEALEKQLAQINSGKVSVQASPSANTTKSQIKKEETTVAQPVSETKHISSNIQEVTVQESEQFEATGNHNTQSMGLINRLLMHPKMSGPIKAAFQAGKVFVLSESNENVTLGVPNKTFFDKLNEARKVKVVEEALSEVINKNIKVRFELSNEVPLSVETIHRISMQESTTQEIKNSEEIKLIPKEQTEETKSKEFTESSNTATINQIAQGEEVDEIMGTAAHILGARAIK